MSGIQYYNGINHEVLQITCIMIMRWNLKVWLSMELIISAHVSYLLDTNNDEQMAIIHKNSTWFLSNTATFYSFIVMAKDIM